MTAHRALLVLMSVVDCAHVCVSASLEHLLEQQTGLSVNEPREEIFWVLSPPDSASLKNGIMQSKQQIISKAASL